jgi:hypothetical protein
MHKDTLFNSELFSGKFGSYLLDVGSLKNWELSKGFRIIKTNPPIDNYDYVQVELVLEEYRQNNKSLTQEDAFRAVQNNPNLIGDKFAQHLIFAMELLANDSRTKISNLIFESLKIGELKLLDFVSKLPISHEELGALLSRLSQVVNQSLGRAYALRHFLISNPHTLTGDIETSQTESKLADEGTNASDAGQAGDAQILTDVKYWATTNSLVEAFEPYGLTEKKIRNGSTKYIGDARKLQGQGGRGRAVQPMFCPYEIMQGLVNKAKPKLLNERRGWEILEKRFANTYGKFQEQDPRKYTD